MTVAELLPLVRRMARTVVQRLPTNVELDDLMQSGMIGALDAMTRFDPAREASVDTFVRKRIRGAILDELRGCDHLSRHMRPQAKRLAAATDALTAELHGRPTERELALHLGLADVELRTLRIEGGGITLVSLDDLAPGQEGGDTLVELLAGDDTVLQNPLADPAVCATLHQAVDDLPDDEREVLRLRFDEGMLLDEIGERFGVTGSRICQLQAAAVERLRRAMAGLPAKRVNRRGGIKRTHVPRPVQPTPAPLPMGDIFMSDIVRGAGPSLLRTAPGARIEAAYG